MITAQTLADMVAGHMPKAGLAALVAALERKQQEVDKIATQPDTACREAAEALRTGYANWTGEVL